MSDDKSNSTPQKRGRGRPRTKPINTTPKKPIGRPKKEFKDSDVELDFKRPRGRPRKYPEGYIREINTDEYFKNGRPSVFNEEKFVEHVFNHCEMINALHRYYIEFEAWCESRSYSSSKRMYFWIMRILKQVNIRREQIKQFQNSRDPRFNPEVYKVAAVDAALRQEQELIDDMEAAIKRLREQAGLQND
jgi:hypothetical protein